MYAFLDIHCLIDTQIDSIIIIIHTGYNLSDNINNIERIQLCITIIGRIYTCTDD